MRYNKYLLIAFIVLCLIIVYQTIIVRSVIERFEGKNDNNSDKKKESASEAVMKALGNTIKAANSVGKRMLNPEVWADRMKLINKSPMDLARMHIMSNS
jgi:hypothetical protein